MLCSSCKPHSADSPATSSLWRNFSSPAAVLATDRSSRMSSKTWRWQAITTNFSAKIRKSRSMKSTSGKLQERTSKPSTSLQKPSPTQKTSSPRCSGFARMTSYCPMTGANSSFPTCPSPTSFRQQLDAFANHERTVNKAKFRIPEGKA